MLRGRPARAVLTPSTVYRAPEVRKAIGEATSTSAGWREGVSGEATPSAAREAYLPYVERAAEGVNEAAGLFSPTG